jgi:radical SAM superfamily enzyme with C-terminal helix-hairpin-helix motif
MRREEGETAEAFQARVQAATGPVAGRVERTADGEVRETTKRLRFELTTPDLERIVSETLAEGLAAIKPTNRASAIRGVRELLASRAEIVNSAGTVVDAPEVLIANLAMQLHAPSTRVDQPRTKPRLRDQVRGK